MKTHSAESLTTLLTALRRATQPEDVFGALAGDHAEALKHAYRRLVQLTHPDRHPHAPADAAEAFALVQQWYDRAKRKAAADAYGKQPVIDVTIGNERFIGYTKPIEGDLCRLFPAQSDEQAVLIKAVRHPRHNELVQAEAAALQRLNAALAGQAVSAHLPTLVAPVCVTGMAGVPLYANVIAEEAETVTLAQIMAAYPQGIDSADMAWMFNRLLVALALAHDVGLVHGAVTPDHVLIRPSDHNAVLIDWCYSMRVGQPVRATVAAHHATYAPELLRGEPATPASDIYMAALCMLRLIGGDVATQRLPPHAPKPIAAFLRGCLLPAPHRRPQSAWALFEAFGATLRRLYGPPHFRPFSVPLQKQ